jgi:ABC-type uncharacterized transport system substrate-binding protein
LGVKRTANPVELGLVASLSRPGGNITGTTQLNVEIGPKRLELVRELIPTATIVGMLVNPTNPADEPVAESGGGGAHPWAQAGCPPREHGATSR